MAETIRDLLEPHDAAAPGDPRPRPADAGPWGAARAGRRHRGGAQRVERHRPRRPGSDRAAERAGDGGGVHRGAPTVHRGALNPAYREEEFDFYLGDLRAKALSSRGGRESGGAVARAGRGDAAPARARRRPAGLSELQPEPGTLPHRWHAEPAADDVALVLHTSGTTARPKLVPLQQRNLAASARHIRTRWS